MKIRGFVWLETIVDKLASKHNVSIGEVEQVFANAPHFRFVESGNREGENVYTAQGQTNGGRYLIVFLILKINGYALIVSACEMTSAERRCMNSIKRTSISDADSVEAIGEFWDAHDLGEHWDETREVHFEVELSGEKLLLPLEKTLGEKLRLAAQKRGVSPETLANLWLQERITQDLAA